MNAKQAIREREAFTLIEMIIAITVFTIFIGFSISAYLTFHRADQDALTTRSLLMDSEAILNELSDATRENKIDYDAYSGLSSCGGSGSGSLYLISSDGEEKTVYTWYVDTESLSVARFAADCTALSEEQQLNSENLAVSYVNFEIFPAANPYDDPTTTQYQPIVIFDLSFSMAGRMTEELTLDLRTSVTSRFYQ